MGVSQWAGQQGASRGRWAGLAVSGSDKEPPARLRPFGLWGAALDPGNLSGAANGVGARVPMRWPPLPPPCGWHCCLSTRVSSCTWDSRWRELDSGALRAVWGHPIRAWSVGLLGDACCLLPDGKEQPWSPQEGDGPQSNPPLIPGWASRWRWRLQSLAAWAPLPSEPGAPWQAQRSPGTGTQGPWPSLQKAGAFGPPAPRRQHSFGKWCPRR